MKKLKKWQLLSLIAAAVIIVFGGIGVLLNSLTSNSSQAETNYVLESAKEGSIASTVLLSGNISSDSEQYVYYDATKGDLSSVLVNVGDQVTVGQGLVQYSSEDLQATYDTAVRALNKVDRQIYDLKTYGITVAVTGDSSADSQTEASTQRTVDGQLKDLQDSRADAVDQVNKAQRALDATTVTSTINGTVVEVKHDVSKSTTGSNQTLVHVVNNGTLQVKGELSEYNFANVSKDQEVTITSKVYPDKTWTGKISYISEYPKDAQASASTATTSSGAKYPFTVELTSDAGELKQGFSVNIEVKNNTSGILIPVSAVVTEGDKNYVWVVENGKAQRKEVTLGSADAQNQEIKSGITKDQKVITNPNANLEDGQEVKTDEKTDQSN